MEFGVDFFTLITLLLLLLVAGVKTVANSTNYKACHTEITKDGDQNFTWIHSNITDYVISEPPCLNKNAMIITRKCSIFSGEWTPKNFSKCDYVQKNYICPEDLIEIPINSTANPLCIKISNQVVDNRLSQCFGSDTILDIDYNEREKILDYLRIANINTFWLPAQKAEKNINSDIKNNCKIAIIKQAPIFKISDCNERHYAVCIFKPMNLAVRSLCPKGYGALIYQPNICYGTQSLLRKNQNVRPLNITEYFAKRNTILQIFSIIKLEEEKFFLVGTKHIDGTEHNLLMNKKGKLKLGSSHRLGKHLVVKMLKPSKPLLISNLVIPKEHKRHTYAMFFYIVCDVGTSQKFHDNKKELEEQAKKNIKTFINDRGQKFKALNIHTVRVVRLMNKESLDKYLQKITVLCHVSASLNKTAPAEVSSQEYDEENLGIRHDIMLFAMIRKYLNELWQFINPKKSSVNSTEFCFAEPVSNNSKNLWSTVTLGEISTTSENYLQPNGAPIVRRCVGDSIYGAMWEKFKSKQGIPPNMITRKLIKIDSSNQPPEDPEGTLKHINEIVGENRNDLVAADVYYLSRIIRTITNKLISLKSSPKKQNITTARISDIISLYNNLMKVNESVIKPSVALNSTNVLLDAFEKFIDDASTISELKLTGTNSSNNVTNHDGVYNIIEINEYHNGVIARIAFKLIVVFIDPNVANVTGMGFYKSKTDKTIDNDNSVGNINLKYLYSNQSVEEFLEEDDLEIATFVPATLLNHFKNIDRTKNRTSKDVPNSPRIVVKLYTNDRLFQEDRPITNQQVYNYIVSLSIPGYDRNLSEQIPLVMRKPSYSNESELCRSWDFKTWSKEGIEFLRTSKTNKNLVLCGAWHLSSFTYLFGENDIPKSHRKALDKITFIGCSLSLIGIMGIFMTGIIFRKWRQMDGSKVLLNLSLAIALQMIIFCCVNTELLKAKEDWICVALGASLQYSVLVQFSWMTIIAYLSFNKFVTIFNRSKCDWFFVKCFFIGWIVPLIPELLTIWYDPKSYFPHKNSGSVMCYPTGKALYLGIFLPIAIVIFGNYIIYIYIIHSIFSRKNKYVIHHHDKQIPMAEIRVTTLLFFLLGLTWIFGLLSAIKAGRIFSYLFCITATIQGFVLFVHFILLDPATRKMWKGLFVKR